MSFTDDDNVCSFQIIQEMTTNSQIKTTSVQTDPLDFASIGTTTLQPGKSVECQAGDEPLTKLTKDDFDARELSGFIRKSAKYIDKAMKEQKVLSNTLDYWKAGSKTIQGTRELLNLALELTSDVREVGKFGVACMEFNPTGMVLLVGLENLQDNSEGTSKILAFSLFKSDSKARKPIWTINTTSSVTTMSFYPRKNSIIAVGHKNGMVSLYDLERLEKDANPLINSSDINEFTHVKSITSLEWCIYKVETAAKIVLSSSSEDGKQILWDMADKLAIPKRGFLVSKEKSNTGDHILLPATYARQNPSTKNEFIVATSTGLLIKMMHPRIISDKIHKSSLANPSNFLKV